MVGIWVNIDKKKLCNLKGPLMGIIRGLNCRLVAQLTLHTGSQSNFKPTEFECPYDHFSSQELFFSWVYMLLHIFLSYIYSKNVLFNHDGFLKSACSGFPFRNM